MCVWRCLTVPADKIEFRTFGGEKDANKWRTLFTFIRILFFLFKKKKELNFQQRCTSAVLQTASAHFHNIIFFSFVFVYRLSMPRHYYVFAAHTCSTVNGFKLFSPPWINNWMKKETKFHTLFFRQITFAELVTCSPLFVFVSLYFIRFLLLLLLSVHFVDDACALPLYAIR